MNAPNGICLDASVYFKIDADYMIYIYIYVYIIYLNSIGELDFV